MKYNIRQAFRVQKFPAKPECRIPERRISRWKTESALMTQQQKMTVWGWKNMKQALRISSAAQYADDHFHSGRMGDGKSSLMKRVEKDVLENADTAGKIYWINFNTWTFSQFGMDEKPRQFFISRLTDELEKAVRQKMPRKKKNPIGS